MDELHLLKELLDRAFESQVISSAQKRFYLLKYNKGELTLSQIQEQIARFPIRQHTLQYGEYILESSLGQGGMGEIFVAYHRSTGKRVALKKVKASYMQSSIAQDKARKRFLRECSLQAKLHHPNIVQVYDYGCYGEDLFLVTQLIDGETMQEFVERESNDSQNYYRILLPQLLIKMQDICDAVDYAHKQGIIHRDINPRNIMLDQNHEIWIMDFGLAKRFDTDMTKITKSTEIIGTPSYMSPEQWHNTNIGPWSDIYSLGATLYYLVAGGVPPYSEDPLSVAHNIINQIPPVPIEDYGGPIPEVMAPVIEKAMSYHPTERYPDAQALKEAIYLSLKKLRSSISKRILVKFLNIFSEDS